MYHRVDPVVYTIDNFADPSTCEHMIKTGVQTLKPARVSSTQGALCHKARTNSSTWIQKHADERISNLAKRIAEEIKIPLEYAENFQFVHYKQGEEFEQHFDAFDCKIRAQKKSQRIWTCLLYLNDIEHDSGGSTYFPELNLRVIPKQGRLLVFRNTVAPHNAIHPLSLHAGEPVKRGEKYACNLWFRDQVQVPTLNLKSVHDLR